MAAGSKTGNTPQQSLAFNCKIGSNTQKATGMTRQSSSTRKPGHAMHAEVERWVVCATGARQSDALLTGLEQVMFKIHKRCHCETTQVIQHAWQDDPAAIAHRIFRHRPSKHSPKVVLIGYSWGGMTCVNVAKELKKRGIDVEALILSDAVWRSRWPLLYWASLLRHRSIEIPSNVRNLWTWRQSNSEPHGSAITFEDCEKTSWRRNEITSKVTHSYMDEHPEFQKTALENSCPLQCEE